MKVMSVIGARPQFVKAAVVSDRMAVESSIEEVMVHTGQHYDSNMSDVFFKELDIRAPAFNLSVGSGTHGGQTGRMLEALDNLIRDIKPDCLVVYGDTNSTLAAALAAVKLHVPVAHVESGLRSYNRAMPEEINRVVADHVSDLLFVPTDGAKKNLQAEGISGEKVCVVGDVMYDLALRFSSVADEKSSVVEKLGLDDKGFILSTIHRAENTDDPTRLRAIFEGLREASESLPVVCPLHPRTHKFLEAMGWDVEGDERLQFIEPIGYLDMIALERHARLVVTDSGGVQKEAFFHGVPCVTLREETEWVELLEMGWNLLVPPLTKEAVLSGVRKGLKLCGTPGTPYGTGNSADLIVQQLLASYGT